MLCREEDEMPVAKVNGINMYYETHGEGEPIVLIMGLGGTAEMWFRQVPGLSKGHRVIAFDNRGVGRSDKPDVEYTMSMLAQDTAGLLDTLEIGAAHIYGVSMGGMVAQNFALRWPKRVLSLILGCTSCGGQHFILPDAEALDFLVSWHHRGQLTPEGRTRRLVPFNFSQEFISSRPAIVEQFISKTVQYWPPPHTFERQAQAVLTHDTYDRLPRIKAPTLVIAGSADRQVPVENSRILASRLPNAELVVLKNMGHGFFIEGAEEANREILRFLRQCARVV